MFRLLVLFLSLAFGCFASTHVTAQAVDKHSLTANLVNLELFVRSDLPSGKEAIAYVNRLQQRVVGLRVQIHEVQKDRQQLARLYELTKKFGRSKPVVPAFHACNRMYFGFEDEIKSGPRIEELMTVDVYTRVTCSKCNTAKLFIKDLKKRWPAIHFRILDVTDDAGARAKWEALCRAGGMVPGLPTFDFAGRVIVGYQGDEMTGKSLEQLIQKVSAVEPIAGPPLGRFEARQFTPVFALSTNTARVFSGVSYSLVATAQDLDADALALPEEASEAEIGAEALSHPPSTTEGSSVESIEVPLFGRLRVNELGMPLFTVLVGLVDGFNPCAMWILVFLLSVLVNIKDRRKILLIAGTFVLVSGLAYFTFMAAWLNIFVLIGIVRPVQIALGFLAIFIGVINVKDFFVFKQGLSLSIPDSSKPGLYKRVRQIVDAKYLSVALTGAIALAVIVNVVELLCTAGLPALYTQILTLQNFPTWKNYGYLGLYIAAYMFDDALLVGVVVVTLSHRKLQEREGRWLKLVSGLVILGLGMVMVFRPEWLHLGGE